MKSFPMTANYTVNSKQQHSKTKSEFILPQTYSLGSNPLTPIRLSKYPDKFEKSTKFDLKLIQKYIEKDIERKLSTKQKQLLKQNKEFLQTINFGKKVQGAGELRLVGGQSSNVSSFNPGSALPKLSRRTQSINVFPSLMTPQANADRKKVEIQLDTPKYFDSRANSKIRVEDSPKNIKTDTSNFNFEPTQTILSNYPQNNNAQPPLQPQNTLSAFHKSASSKQLDKQLTQNQIQEFVSQQLYKKDMNLGQKNYVLQRIQNFVEGESTKQIQLKNQSRVQTMEEQTRKEILSKRFSQKIDDDDEELIRVIKKHMPPGHNEKQRDKYLLTQKEFDFHKYQVVSPFHKPKTLRARRNLSRQIQTLESDNLSRGTSPSKKSIIPETRNKVDQILKDCNKIHNQLADFCKFKGRKMQKQMKNFEQSNKMILNQINTTKDMMFLEMCKFQRQQKEYVDPIEENQKKEWRKMIGDIDKQVQQKEEHKYEFKDDWKYYSLLLMGKKQSTIDFEKELFADDVLEQFESFQKD
ncbi:UNKNOWN [Stylonychia lemnae]|uniref:Uncharacterized protein n=1 Tax=Stylonychia lemnae TaxID=5949 RepID=A0A078A7F0_STYLE|nr:UNKNOWN [Stylonychia lemnae]|eukprot:CDW77472.1 UNKNOWN [Stylonychia lemnae]